ncbi:hypothetical protein CRUP_005963 [Coryphaenoides rupestris]|nr:hypothetical protein CRUP_005963 [Coryphaenoides rupestris]
MKATLLVPCCTLMKPHSRRHAGGGIVTEDDMERSRRISSGALRGTSELSRAAAVFWASSAALLNTALCIMAGPELLVPAEYGRTLHSWTRYGDGMLFADRTERRFKNYTDIPEEA